VAVERRKETDKTAAEIAAEQTKASKGGDGGEESKPARRSQRKPAAKSKREAEPKAKATEAKGGKPKDDKPTEAKPTTRRRRTAEPKAADKPRTRAKQADDAEGTEKKAPARTRSSGTRGTRRAAPRSRERAEAPRPVPSRPTVRAQAKYVRSSARKARLVIDHIRGKSVVEARAVLRHTPRGVARDVEKLLASAVANAENNHELVGDDLLVKEAYADEGPTLKRFRPRALGRATRIRKRTSHLTVTLTTKE
jgi:ribosomal protein L22